MYVTLNTITGVVGFNWNKSTPQPIMDLLFLLAHLIHDERAYIVDATNPKPIK